jgi:hypothetical protein
MGSSAIWQWRTGAAIEVVSLWRSRKPAYEYDPDAERHNELLFPRERRIRE